MSWLHRRGRTQGYVTAPAGRARRWHTDPNCGASTWPKRARGRRVSVRANTALLLAHDMGALGVTPCERCARPAILDEVAASASGGGYHALICGSSDTSGACRRCADLTAYAAAHGNLTAYALGGRVAVLRPGLSSLDSDALSVLWLEVRDASGDLPAITAPMWATAAALFGGPTTLADALAAAAALHASPAGR